MKICKCNTFIHADCQKKMMRFQTNPTKCTVCLEKYTNVTMYKKYKINTGFYLVISLLFLSILVLLILSEEKKKSDAFQPNKWPWKDQTYACGYMWTLMSYSCDDVPEIIENAETFVCCFIISCTVTLFMLIKTIVDETSLVFEIDRSVF